jgi:hypothetical protein
MRIGQNLSASSLQQSKPMPSLMDKLRSSFGEELAEKIASAPLNKKPTNLPSWYGQFGEMTQFVPQQFRDPLFEPPPFPVNPDKVHIRQFALNTTLTGKDLANAWRAQRPALTADKIAWREELKNIKQQLDNNFTKLPQSVQDSANAARYAVIAARNASI